MTKPLRGADIVVEALTTLGCKHIFTLSGNHIMSIFDAALGSGLDLVHVRHEAAAVHMADAWGRLTGEAGIALVTGGPGHANAVGALFTARGAESPMVLLSGHAATWELGRGGFQEIRQAEMAAPVTKASWTAKSAAGLGADIAEAIRIATSGRPGPVHLSLPSDLLDARVTASAPIPHRTNSSSPAALSEPVADAILDAIAAAKSPVILAGPHLSNQAGRALLARLETVVGAPAVILESPRGLADATLGAFVDVARDADLIVLLGKELDFTLKWAADPMFNPAVRLIIIDPDPEMVARAMREKREKLLLGAIADAHEAAETLLRRAQLKTRPRNDSWLARSRRDIDQRPAAWTNVVSQTNGRLHPAEVFRALHPFVAEDPDTILICDGGEFAQWGQSMLPVGRRLINGVAGAIGGSLSFALAARTLDPKAPIFAVLGDGTIGFHISEFETAVRRKLPFVAVLGNDACWNAESQIQLKDYGRERMHGCELLPARYDKVVEAFGGHGELVEKPAELAPAIERAIASGKPACINIMTESIAAPSLRRQV